MDLVNLKDDLQYFDKETLPKIEAAGMRLLDRLERIASVKEISKALDGATITITIKLKEKLE